MKVTIQEWSAVASWRWDMPEDDVCGICRVQFDGTCPTCKYPGDDCTLRMPHISSRPRPWANEEVIGKCGHSFHMVIARADTFPIVQGLIIISIVSLPGLSKTLRKGCVRCADKVRFVISFPQHRVDWPLEFEWKQSGE